MDLHEEIIDALPKSCFSAQRDVCFRESAGGYPTGKRSRADREEEFADQFLGQQFRQGLSIRHSIGLGGGISRHRSPPIVSASSWQRARTESPPPHRAGREVVPPHQERGFVPNAPPRATRQLGPAGVGP